MRIQRRVVRPNQPPAPGGLPPSPRLAAVGAVWALVLGGLILLPVAIGLLAWREQTPREVVVPDLVGRTVEQGQQTLRARHLRIAVVEGVHDPNVPAGVILWSDPPVGRVVREEREIAVRVSKGARGVVVPDVTQLPLSDASERLEKAGLALGEPAKADSETLPEGTVICQAPRSGHTVPEGTSVELLVSTGRSPRPKVPKDYQQQEAKIARVTVDVPQGDPAQRVQIKVRDAAGEWTAYDFLHEPGDTVEKRIVARGKAKLTVSIDGQVIEEREL